LKTKSIHKPKVNVVTLGCSKNVVDSEVMMAQLRENQFDVKHESNEEKDNEIVIVNTCGFIDNAKEESINTILRFADAKKEGTVSKLYVTGCLSERYKNDLEEQIPEVDAYFGTLELPQLLNTLGADYKHELIGERLLTTPAHFAYLKISEGCNRKCAFCAIPLMRGKHISKSMDDLVTEAKNLVKQGVKELILIAQELTYYGLDLYGGRKLPELLRRLSDVEGVEWIRLHYAYPTMFPMDIIDAMAERSNICNYLDIPLQHTSNRMLKAMHRGITNEKTVELLNNIKSQIPEMAIRTTMLVGFPGEKEEDVDHMINFMEQVQFDRLGVFTYSHEENTSGYKLEDNVDHQTKLDRANRVMAAQANISYQVNQAKIGKTFKVLFDKKEGGHFIGRTEFDSPEVDNEVLVDAKDTYVRVGDFANIKITDATEFDLFGKKV